MFLLSQFYQFYFGASCSGDGESGLWSNCVYLLNQQVYLLNQQRKEDQVSMLRKALARCANLSKLRNVTKYSGCFLLLQVVLLHMMIYKR